jgi:protein involved in polysaccharide export with SLBB domain
MGFRNSHEIMLLKIRILMCACACFVALPAFAQSTGSGTLPWSEKQKRFAEAYRGEFEEPGQRDIPAANPADPQNAKRPPMASGLPAPDEFLKERAEEKTLSPLEKMYTQRAGETLQQYGYDMFGVPDPTLQKQLDAAATQRPETLPPMGAVQDDFILGSGDELEVVFTGQRTDRGVYKVNAQGLVLVEDLPPIPAAGRSIGQVRISIAAAAQNLYNTQAYVSLATVRQIGVLVVGHVKKPGRRTMTVFHTVLDALMESGGIGKTGSLRQIKLVRGGKSTVVDIYDLLLNGNAGLDLGLRDGDRIIVPAIGPTLAVAGEAKRPGIFELRPGEVLNLNQVMELAGGVLSPGKNRFLKLSITGQGREQAQEIRQDGPAAFGDGTMLVIARGTEKRAGTIALRGHTPRPGLYALKETPTLAALLASEDMLGPDVYPLAGVIKRWDSRHLAHSLLVFPIRSVLKNYPDLDLQEGDEINLFSADEIAALFEAEKPGKDEASSKPPETISETGSALSENKIKDKMIAAFLRERAALVRGAVRKPGSYPVADGITLDSLLAAAGGPTIEANTANVEVTTDLQGVPAGPGERRGIQRLRIDLAQTPAEQVMIGPGDSVRINQKFKKIENQSVLIMGEVISPGRYDLMPGDRISDLIARAGSFTDEAYPDGAIFSRKSERAAEEARFKAQAREIKNAVAAALQIDEEKIDTGKIAEARALAAELENAEGVGRITVEADLGTLETHPELDMLLEPGDRLYIPRRALAVRVRGEILSPASLQFRQDKEPADYIREAGGFTYHADKERAFVLLPDGSAQPLQVSAWSHHATFIPPGSTIVVPRDPEPFDFIESAKDISQILSNLAITAIFIDDVRDKD